MVIFQADCENWSRECKVLSRAWCLAQGRLSIQGHSVYAYVFLHVYYVQIMHMEAEFSSTDGHITHMDIILIEAEFSITDIFKFTW